MSTGSRYIHIESSPVLNVKSVPNKPHRAADTDVDITAVVDRRMATLILITGWVQIRSIVQRPNCDRKQFLILRP